jgi:protein involved in polysaccharide export with SLBB domain
MHGFGTMLFYRSSRDTIVSSLRQFAYAVIACALIIRPVGAQDAGQSTGQELRPATQAGTVQPCYEGGLQPVPDSIGSRARHAESAFSATEEPQSDRQLEQPQISAAGLIAILQSAPDSAASLKNELGQAFGVDPTLISDAGLYNCVRVDVKFRTVVGDELREQGYAAPAEEPSLSTQEPRERDYASAEEPALSAQRPREQSYTHTPEAQNLAVNSSRAGVRSGMESRVPEQAAPNHIQTTKRTPYSQLPSLKELYTQDVAATQNLRRFGSDMFRLGTGNANQLPADLPVGPDYILGPGDSLMVNMWGGQSARIERTIDRQGQIALAEAGTVTLSGLTIAQGQAAVERALSTQYQNEHVELSLGRVRTVRIYVVGDVQRPGAYDVSSLSTPMNALYAAGGPTSRGSLRTLRHMRGSQLVREIDLYDLLLRGMHSDIERLQPGDTILVPTVGAQVSVGGMVRRPAIYELREEHDLSEVLALAGGVMATANVQQVRVTRVEAHERRTMLSVPVHGEFPATGKMLPPFPVQDQDEVLVSPILPYNERAVYLDGHVFKPGPYAWHEGMTLADVIHSYQDLMPEPAEHAEIIRLQPPDFRPQAISFNVPALLIGDDPVKLQPFDVIRIFGRYEIDPPIVSIFGQVLRPGSYPMSDGMTVAGLVRMAGGFRRSAYQDEADLTSYEVQNGQKIQIGHSVIALAKALGGDNSADILLKPGDVVGIRQMSGWQDIGASISIEGEVRFAGQYGISEGERLSSVLKRAGGFWGNAYPAGAVLERVQVRQMEEVNRQEMIRRLESSTPQIASGIGTTGQDQQNTLQSMRQQQQDVLASLRSHPSKGRLVLKISDDISKWENTPADILVRAGDKLTIPKRPDFVLVSGQVYNATAITYHPRETAGWYLHQAGGATRSGDKKNIFILRADGSVVGDGGSVLFGEGILNTRMFPGDSVIVPEKIVGGPTIWRNVLETAQVMSSMAMTGALMATR